MPKELAEVPDCPEHMQYLWEWFKQINKGGEFTWTNLHAWSALHGVQLTRGELRLLSAVNSTYISVSNGRRHHKSSSKG